MNPVDRLAEAEKQIGIALEDLQREDAPLRGSTRFHLTKLADNVSTVRKQVAEDTRYDLRGNTAAELPDSNDGN